ncbi:MAG: sugar ABC transporter substrate-binding protein [Actinomycetia bacterium]|nr:sugar ABC transporter substrate-binding protein [Actinomycetes bacterium]
MNSITRRSLLAVTAGVGSALALAACSGAGAGRAGASGSAGGELNVLMVGNPQMKDIQEMVSDFTSKTGISVKFTILPENELRDKVAQDVSTKAGQYDVVTIGAYEGSVWTANDWLTNLQPLATKEAEFDVNDLMPAMKGVLSKGGDLYAIPFYGESAMTMYRQDLFTKHGLTMPDEPTWTDIRTLAEKLKAAEPSISPVVMRGLPGWGENMAVVGSMVNSFGGAFFDADWKPLLTSPEVTECITYYVDLVKSFGQKGAPQAGFTECLNTMSQGGAGIWFDATSAANSLESPASSKIVGKVGYADAPKMKARSGWVWAWAWAIPKTTKKLDNAWKFVAWASGKEYEQAVGKKLGWTRVPDGKRLSTFQIPEYKEASKAYSQVMLTALERSDPTNCGVQKRPAPGCQYLAIPELADLGTKIGQQVSAALAGQKSVADALAACQAAAETVAAKHK